MTNLLLVGNGRQGAKYRSIIPDLIVANRDWHSSLDVSDPPIHGVIIATPPNTHISIAQYFLSSNIPVMIEKPLSLSSIEARRLEKYDQRKILVNHVHLFSDSYQSMKMKMPNPSSLTIKTGGDVERKEYSRLWDYGSHGIALAIDYMMTNDLPTVVNSDLDNICLSFGSERTANINIPRRKIVEMVAQQDSVAQVYENDPRCLQSAIKVFLDMIDGKTDYRCGASLGINVLNILEKCTSGSK